MTGGDTPAGVGDYIALIRRRWLLVATIVPASIFLALALAFGLPVEYRSSATLILEPSAIQEKLIATTVTSYADQQIELVQGRVMDISTLEKLVKTFDPYPTKKEWGSNEKAEAIVSNTEVERVDAVTLEPLEKSNAFSLHYQNPDPKLAAEGARQLADLFLTYHQKVRADAAGQATAFLAQQAEGVSAELQKVDQEVAQLKDKYGNALPDSQDRSEVARDRIERDVEGLERDLRNSQEKESLLTIQLNSLSPRMISSKGDMTDLATVRAKLAEARQKYTADHPDVKMYERALEGLAAQGAKDSSAARADNPEYLRVAGQLEAARREVVALRATLERSRAQLFEYSRSIRAAPGVERLYADLERRREVLRAQFQEIQTKLGEARLGQLFESEQRGERFAMVRPPLIASRPHSPNRPGLILLGVILGMAVCAITIAIAESSDPTVRGVKDMQVIEQWSLLGAVPEIMIDADRRRRIRLVSTLTAGYALGVAIVFGVITQANASGSPSEAVSIQSDLRLDLEHLR